MTSFINSSLQAVTKSQSSFCASQVLHFIPGHRAGFVSGRVLEAGEGATGMALVKKL